tara:strand:+ start:518 stop:718 length:201 start_codon:yes stop_codon:yes gene_type:complete
MDLKKGTLEDALRTLDLEMKAMWDTGEITKHIGKDGDPEYVRTIMYALYYERLRFQMEIDVTIGEA